jgi:hypothetical protein
LEDASVRASQNEFAAGFKHAPDFAESLTTEGLRDVLDHLDTGDVVEGIIGKGQERAVALAEIRLRDIAPRNLDGGGVHIDPGQLERRI